MMEIYPWKFYIQLNIFEVIIFSDSFSKFLSDFFFNNAYLYLHITYISEDFY